MLCFHRTEYTVDDHFLIRSKYNILIWRAERKYFLDNIVIRIYFFFSQRTTWTRYILIQPRTFIKKVIHVVLTIPIKHSTFNEGINRCF